MAMQHAAAPNDRLAFAPPPQPGLLRAFVLAVIAHLLLLLALTQGLQWQREEQNIAAEAELWAAVPQQAAPREVAVPPPPPAPEVVRAPPLPERPVVKPPEPPVQRDADIALEREKQRREAEKRKVAEQRERDERRKAEAQKLEVQKKREEAEARRKQEAKLLAEAKRKEAEQKRKDAEAREARDEKQRAQLREDNLRRIQGMAGSGAPDAAGTAARSSGPSAGWGARVQARVKPNIVFSDDVSGNPEAVVEVRLAPDGTITSRRIKKSSGHRGWDEAVLRALDRTEVLPRDTDGRVPSGGDLVFRPKN
jgi:colicin import membrane protein